MIAACSPSSVHQTDELSKPTRIVSLDYCADQYVLKFADADQILALSPDAVKEFSYMREFARGIPSVRPIAEDVLVLKPDLVVRSYGGGPNVAQLFERAGIPVLQMGWVVSLDGDEDGTIPTIMKNMAAGMGWPERGDDAVLEYKSRLNAVRGRKVDKTALYVTPAGATSGPGSLVHEIFVAAGLENFEAQPGWRSLPLERLAYESPDLVAAAFFESFAHSTDQWSPSRHPVAQTQLETRERVELSGAWTACGGWFVADAVEALAEGGE